MSSRRTAKVAEAIRETVSTTVLFGLKDPRVKNVTVIAAEVSPDLRNAKVYVSVMGDEKAQSLTMHGLEAARGFIQSKVADRLQTKYTPILKFVLDPGVKFSAMASATLREVLGHEAASAQMAEEVAATEGAGPATAARSSAQSGSTDDGSTGDESTGDDPTSAERAADAASLPRNVTTEPLPHSDSKTTAP